MLVSELYPTDAGWFPSARHHRFVRLTGAEENILIYCVKGRGWFEIDGQRQSLLHGHALLIPKGRPHSYGAEETDPWSIHWIHFAGEDAVCYSSRLPLGEHVLPVAPDIAARLEQLFMECHDVFTDGFTLSRILFAAQVLRHLLALLFHCNPTFSPGTSRASHRSFDHIIEHMRQHLDGSLSLKTLAREASLSVARFSVLFKSQTGFSPVEYYIRIRIQSACRLFDTTSLNVSEVAAHVGYQDQYYFSRIFSKIMGVPPSAYRKAKKG